MYTTLFLFLATLPPDDGQAVRAEIGGDKGTECSFASRYNGEKGAVVKTTLSDTVSNYLNDATLFYTISGGGKGALVAATRAPKGDVAPRSVTMARTSYRPIRQVLLEIKGSVPATGDSFVFGGVRWEETGVPPRAFPGGELENRLIDGDAKGKIRVRLVSKVSGDAHKGYTYTYTVENLTDRPIQVKWAGLEGRVQPGKLLTKSETASRLTEEQTDLAVIAAGEATFEVRSNLWARPK